MKLVRESIFSGPSEEKIQKHLSESDVEDALNACISNNYLGGVKYVLNNRKDELDQETLLKAFVSAINYDELEISKYLFWHINDEEFDSDVILEAISRAHEEILDLILKRFPNVKVPTENHQYEMAIHMAIQDDDYEYLKKMFKIGDSPEFKEYVEYALDEEKEEVADWIEDYFIDELDPTSKNIYKTINK